MKGVQQELFPPRTHGFPQPVRLFGALHRLLESSGCMQGMRHHRPAYLSLRGLGPPFKHAMMDER
jgi:hypothetical protein